MDQQLRAVHRSNALFRAASDDFLLREQLASDPAHIIHEYIHGKPMSDEDAVAANHLLQALLSSPRMLNWMTQLAAQNAKRPLSDAQIARQLAVAMEQSADRAVVAALIRYGTTPGARIETALDLLKGILSVIGRGGSAALPAAMGTESTPATGTEATPATGTEATPAGRAQAGTEFTPSTGTNFTPSTGTQATPARRAQAGTEFTPSTGTNFTPSTGTQATPARRVQAGTEFTPSTGTNFTPSTGTKATPGLNFERDLERFQTSVRALIRFAVQMRRSGQLFDTGLRS